MTAGKTVKAVIISAAVMLCAVLFTACGLIYNTKFKITDIDTSVSPGGKYEITYQNVGEPDWPFGYAHVRLVLKQNGKTLTEYKFDVANDGGSPTPEQWQVFWKDDCAEVTITGEEQPDVLYTMYFDGTVKTKENGIIPVDISGDGESEIHIDFSSFITENGVDEEALTGQLDTDVLSAVAAKLQSLVDEEEKEEKENPEIVLSEGYPRVFLKNQYKEVTGMGEKAALPLYYIIYKSENQGMYEHICAVALSEICGLKSADEGGDFPVWSTAEEFLTLFNEYQLSGETRK